MSSWPKNERPYRNALNLLPRRGDFAAKLFEVSMFNRLWSFWRWLATVGDTGPSTKKEALEASMLLLVTDTAVQKGGDTAGDISVVVRALNATEVLDARRRLVSMSSLDERVRLWIRFVHLLFASKNDALREFAADYAGDPISRGFPWALQTEADEPPPDHAWRSILYEMYVGFGMEGDARARRTAPLLLQNLERTAWYNVPTYNEEALKGRKEPTRLGQVLAEVKQQLYDVVAVVAVEALEIRYQLARVQGALALPRAEEIDDFFTSATDIHAPLARLRRTATQFESHLKPWVDAAALTAEDIETVKDLTLRLTESNYRSLQETGVDDLGLNTVFAEALVDYSPIPDDNTALPDIVEHLRDRDAFANQILRESTFQGFRPLLLAPFSGSLGISALAELYDPDALQPDPDLFAVTPAMWRDDLEPIMKRVKREIGSQKWSATFTALKLRDRAALDTLLRALKRAPQAAFLLALDPGTSEDATIVSTHGGKLFATRTDGKPPQTSVTPIETWNLWRSFRRKTRAQEQAHLDGLPAMAMWYIEMVMLGFTEREIETLGILFGDIHLPNYIYRRYRQQRLSQIEIQ